MTRRVVAVIGLLSLCAGGSVWAAEGQRSNASAPARLVVSEKFVDTGAHYIEGAVAYVVVRRLGAARPAIHRRYRGGIWLSELLPPGRYRLASYVRPCAGSCPDPDPPPCHEDRCAEPGGLDAPTDRCGKNFRLRSGQTLRAVVRSGVGVPCRLRFAAHRIAIRGATGRDVALALDLRRYLRRNAGTAAWYPAVREVRAARSVLTVRTTLRRSRRGRAAAREICDLVQGSDVADFTPGHTIRGWKGQRLVSCPAADS